MKTRATAIAAALLFFCAFEGGAQAGHYTWACSGYWRAPASCKIYFTGLPITIFADAEVPSGNAEVNITLSVDGVPDSTLLECHHTAARYAQCDEAIAAGVPGHVNLLMGYVLLSCNVSGVGGSLEGANFFSCASG